ncbi:MAG: hypothetical protein BV456_05445 [Thermoplasmata archaeon M8B2D]|nr:MAG: hypothetical protein BV456_05445 [Thermoplasmata archaeon M8B2D]
MRALVVNLCKEKLHYYEFVKPIEDILKGEGVSFFTKGYLEIGEKDLPGADRVILCGTSLKDFDYLNNLDKFDWLKNFVKPILGICAGMEIIGLIFDGEKAKKLEIGYFKECFEKDFLGLSGDVEVYHLHRSYVDFSSIKNFELYCSGDGIAQAVKSINRPIYGVLFHPEVRNKQVIVNFANEK